MRRAKRAGDIPRPFRVSARRHRLVARRRSAATCRRPADTMRFGISPASASAAAAAAPPERQTSTRSRPSARSGPICRQEAFADRRRSPASRPSITPVSAHSSGVRMSTTSAPVAFISATVRRLDLDLARLAPPIRPRPQQAPPEPAVCPSNHRHPPITFRTRHIMPPAPTAMRRSAAPFLFARAKATFPGTEDAHDPDHRHPGRGRPPLRGGVLRPLGLPAQRQGRLSAGGRGAAGLSRGAAARWCC